MMTTRRDSRTLSGVCLALTLLAVAVAVDPGCDVSKCAGPLRYYKDLGCQPVYQNPGDCCPVSYNCDHLHTRSRDHCYINGHEYNIGDALRPEDTNPCDKACTCQAGRRGGPAAFSCAIIDCYHGPETPGCYRSNSPSQCCAGPLICPDPAKGETRPTCVVDGKTYQDGDHFEVASDPDLTCFCKAGYQGQNVEPFCKKPNRPYCTPEFRNAGNIYDHCAPVFYVHQSPDKDCATGTRCQNSKDVVIPKPGNTNSNGVCQFGNLTMHVGDELNQGTDYTSTCVRCVCEVPPVPTCRRLPQEECSMASG